MKKVVVTGASGFLGTEIIKQLIKSGFEVRALKRKNSNVSALDGLNVEWHIGDVTDANSLKGLFDGIDACFHTAGATSYNLKDKKQLESVNIEGAQNVVLAAKAAGVRKFIHTSSVSAIGFNRDGKIVDETQEYNWPQNLPYMETKAAGEKIVFAEATNSFEVVALNPATILGPGKMNASEEQLVSDIKKQNIPLLPPGGMTVCDIEDVARGHILALQKGKNGERYILGAHHLTHAGLAEKLAKKFGVSCKTQTAPSFLFKVIGGLLSYIEPLGVHIGTDAAVIRLSRFGVYHSSEKAIRELGYSCKSIDEILNRVVSTRK